MNKLKKIPICLSKNCPRHYCKYTIHLVTWILTVKQKYQKYQKKEHNLAYCTKCMKMFLFFTLGLTLLPYPSFFPLVVYLA